MALFDQLSTRLVRDFTQATLTAALAECTRNPLRQPPSSFLAQLYNLRDVTAVYATDEVRKGALEVIPVANITQDAWERERKECGTVSDSPPARYIVQALLEWFKGYFVWTNKPPCPECHNSIQSRLTSLGATRSTLQETQAGDATTTELYRCQECTATFRFPRHNHPLVVLAQRHGRCGEWANGFMAVLGAMDIAARYVWNAEDHVWCEAFLDGRWVHLDSCENAYDQPWLYARGWGKQMSYVFAVNATLFEDVSFKYVDAEHQIPKHTKENPRAVRALVRQLRLHKWVQENQRLAEVYLDYDEARLDEFYASVLQPWCAEQTHKGKVLRASSPPRPSEASTNPTPRTSGAPEWTALRGENGG